MRGRVWLRVCGALLLLVCVSTATWCAVRALRQPEQHLSPASAPPADGAPDHRWQYTQDDLDAALALKTESYSSRSVEDFARALADWTDEAAFHRREESLDRLERTYARDGADADFILRTLAASMGEAATRHYGGHCTSRTDSFSDGAVRQRYEDVFGDPYLVFQALASWRVCYTIPDGNALTVAERDRVLNDYRDGVYAFLDGLSEQQLSDQDAMERKLTRELARLDRSLSTTAMKLEGSELDWYDAYGYGA